MKQSNGTILAAVIATLATAAIARAQPVPPDPYPDPGTPPDAGSGSGSGSGSAEVPPVPTENSDFHPADVDPNTKPKDTYNPNTPKVTLPDHPIDMPVVITTPTGWLLPAAVLYFKTALDTGGGVTSDNRVGLGDVAEFGVATTDAVRAKTTSEEHGERIQPYVTASFRLGVAEHRLFGAQPGLTLGFRKSFERNHDNFKTRIAELTLVASKHLGPRVAIHVGGAFWDASMQESGTDPGTGAPFPETTMHGFDRHWNRQIRGFGGIQVEPIDKSMILIDLGWAPEFCYRCTTPGSQIQLRPELSWGVRYQVSDWMNIESGVRVPDIQKANLLDAQIFGGITFTSWGLRHGIDSLK